MNDLGHTCPDWIPGDPLYRYHGCWTQPMVDVKEEFHDEDMSAEAARWTPELGWCYDN